MEVGTDLYSALCVSEASEPAHGEATIGLGNAMPIICFYFGVGERKWQIDFYYIFQMQCLPFIFKRIYLYNEPSGKQQI